MTIYNVHVHESLFALYLYNNSHLESGDRHTDLEPVSHHSLREAGTPALLHRPQHGCHTPLVQVGLKLA